MASPVQAEMTPSVHEERLETAPPDVQEQRSPSEPNDTVEDASPDPQEHRSPEQSSCTAAAPREKRKIVIIVAGQPGSGKSTALNNLFGTDFEAHSSAYSVTKSVELRRTEGTEGDLIIVDTPAFGATDVRTKDVRKELEDSVGYLDCVLIYCYSIIPGSRLNETDGYVMKNLQQVLGMKIWQKCVVLFTFSDQVRAQSYKGVESREEYKEWIQGRAKKFHEMLEKKCGDHVPNVKTVFDIDPDEEDINDIVAVPVGQELRQGKEKHELVPDIDIDWLDSAFFEIIRKANKENQEVYLDHLLQGKRTILSAAVSGIGVGAAIGVAGGVVTGAATLGFGAIAIPVGAAIGAVIGGAAATTGGLSLRKIRNIIIASRKRERLKKLEEKAQIIRPKAANQCQQTSSGDKKVAEPMASLGTQEVLPPPVSHGQEIKSTTGIHKSLPTPVVPQELPELETCIRKNNIDMDCTSSGTSQEPTAKDSAAENP